MLLEDHAAFRMRVTNRIAVHDDLAVCDAHVSCDGAEQSRFAATGGPEQTHELTGRDVEIERLKGVDARVRRPDFHAQRAHVNASGYFDA